MRGIRMWVWVLAAAVVCCAARADELIADLVPAEQVRRAVAAGTAELFVEAVGASKDQEEAAEAIVSGARAAVQREVNRHLRQIRTGVDSAEAGYASEAQMVKAVREVEQSMVEDMRALTGEEQAAGFERFERDRRRGALLGVYGRGPCPMDIRAELRQLKVVVVEPGATNASSDSPEQLLAAAVTQSEKELDRALVAVGAAEQAYLKSARGSDRDAQKATRNEANAAGDRLVRAQALAWRRITARLEPATVDVLLRVRGKRWFEQHRGSSGELFFGSDETPPTVREVLRLELTEAQRNAVVERLAKFDASYLAMLRAWTTKLDDEAVSGVRGNAHNELLEPRDALRKELEKDVLAMLTDTQRQAYDVSPLVEKTGPWEVEEEREGVR